TPFQELNWAFGSFFCCKGIRARIKQPGEGNVADVRKYLKKYPKFCAVGGTAMQEVITGVVFQKTKLPG
ncbi:MAG TPA: hypothetical protein VJ440_06970, partial [Candidatus Brocadiaceae bacterium]|nr:hypothetical protein [Candidatus Brocadiaceae bacterium]